MPRETDKREVYEAIVDAAERLLDRYGYGKMTMSDLAEEAGIGVGTTYLHFSGKADVALAVVARFAQTHLERLEEIADGPGTAAERLREMLISRVFLRFDMARCQRHPMDEFARDIKAAIGTRCVPWKENEEALYARILEEGRAAGVLACEDVGATVDALFTATYALLPHNLKPEEFQRPEETRQRTVRLVALLMRGLRPGGPGDTDGKTEDAI